jgi:hypothetical protein
VKPKENYKRLRFYMMPQLLILVGRKLSEVQLYETYNKNAQIVLTELNLDKSGRQAMIVCWSWNQFKSRLLSLEDSQLKLNKAKLELSNFFG